MSQEGTLACVIKIIPNQHNFSNLFSHTKPIFFRILYLLCFSLRLDKLSLDIITVLQRWFIKYVSNWPYWIHLDYGWKMKQKKNSRIFPKGKWKNKEQEFLKSFLSFLLFKQFLSSSSSTLFQVSVLFVLLQSQALFSESFPKSLFKGCVNEIMLSLAV